MKLPSLPPGFLRFCLLLFVAGWFIEPCNWLLEGRDWRLLERVRGL